MNIKERNNIILQRLEALRFGHVDHSKDEKTELFNPFQFDWNRLTKPPIAHWLHPQTIQDMHSLVEDVRLMNDPYKKFKYMNQILAPMGFKPAASGTNRRSFYCEYDPTIILKIGSDRVGKSDNISEFYSQSILKPFCTKIYDVLPTGVLQLCERVEPMKEEDFKKKWSKEIFDLVMNLLYRGYMLEDIGGNFYKNWAIRIGFGPVLIDFPYVYEVDFSKLKCVYVNPITKEKCDGELDYDYQKGMSEIVCDKCGSRYSAHYLAKNASASLFRKGKKHMKNQIGIVLTRGNKIVHQNYVESQVPFRPANLPVSPYSNSQRIPTPEKIAQLQEEIKAATTANTQVQESQSQEPVVQKPREILVDIEAGRNRKQERFGIRPTTTRVASNKKQPHNHQGQTRPNNNDRSRFNREPLRDELLPSLTDFLDLICDKFGRGTAIELCRRLGLYWKDYYDREDGLLHNIERGYKEREEARKNEQKQEAIRFEHSQRDTSSQPAERNERPLVQESEGSNNNQVHETDAKNTSDETNGEGNEPIIRAQTEGLFPVKPLTQEEIEAADLKSREDTAAMGFPGEPVAYTMRIKQEVPNLVELVTNNLSGNFEINSENPAATILYLIQAVKNLVSKDVARMCNTDEEGIEVMVNQKVDHMNRICYVVIVENRKSPILEATLYPNIKNSESGTNVSAREIAPGINLLETETPKEESVQEAIEPEVIEVEPLEDTSKTEEEDAVREADIEDHMWEIVHRNLDMMKQEPNEKAEKKFMVTTLIAALKMGGMLQGEANDKAYSFVYSNYPFIENEL